MDVTHSREKAVSCDKEHSPEMKDLKACSPKPVAMDKAATDIDIS